MNAASLVRRLQPRAIGARIDVSDKEALLAALDERSE